MEIPTTSNLENLKAFQETFTQEIRPLAEHEISTMLPAFAKAFDQCRPKLLPASIVIDIMIYLTHHLSEMAADEVMDCKDTGDFNSLILRCDELDPIWKATRSLSLALKVFSQDPAKGEDYIDEYDDEDRCQCFVCGAVASSPLTTADRKACHGGCPMCSDKIEAVFNK